MLPKIDWSDVIGEIIGGLIVAAIVAIIALVSPKFRLSLRRLSGKVISAIKWLAKQWRYLVTVTLLLIPIDVMLYLVYARWWIIAFSVAHLALVILAIPLLFAPKRPWTTSSLIHKIDFDYLPELPTDNGWESSDGPSPDFSTLADDPFVKKALALREVARSGERPYALDYDVESVGRGKFVEFVAKLEPGAAVYAHINVQSKDPIKPKEGWIKLQIGTGKPERHPSGNEWTLYVMPILLVGNWQLFRIDLIDAFNQTLGKDSYSFEQLIGFRLRGNLALAHILVFKS